MHSSNDKKTGVRAEATSAHSLPADLESQLRLATFEITRDLSSLAKEIIGGRGEKVGISQTDQTESSLLFVQEFLFYCLVYARNFSLILNRSYSEELAARLFELFCDSFYKNFFPEDTGPAPFEYFKVLFGKSYQAFVQKMEQKGMLSVSPNEFTAKCVDCIMESHALGPIFKQISTDQTRSRISEFLEKHVFLKISRILLSS